MPTEQEIKTAHKEIHDELTAEFYPLKAAGLIDDELQAIFDVSHGQNWDDMEAELIAAGYRQPPEPVKDPLAELESRVKALEEK